MAHDTANWNTGPKLFAKVLARVLESTMSRLEVKYGRAQAEVTVRLLEETGRPTPVFAFSPSTTSMCPSSSAPLLGAFVQAWRRGYAESLPSAEEQVVASGTDPTASNMREAPPLEEEQANKDGEGSAKPQDPTKRATESPVIQFFGVPASYMPPLPLPKMPKTKRLKIKHPRGQSSPTQGLPPSQAGPQAREKEGKKGKRSSISKMRGVKGVTRESSGGPTRGSGSAEGVTRLREKNQSQEGEGKHDSGDKGAGREGHEGANRDDFGGELVREDDVGAEPPDANIVALYSQKVIKRRGGGQWKLNLVAGVIESKEVRLVFDECRCFLATLL
ncbi:unnamed protein product [Discosporangium mesarthrocarpum]